MKGHVLPCARAHFKLLQNDPDTGRVFSQPPLISFKRDKNIGNFLVRSAFQMSEQPGTLKFFRMTETFSVQPRSSVGRVMVDLYQRSWVRFLLRSKDFFFTSCGSLIPFTRANTQWIIHGFN